MKKSRSFINFENLGAEETEESTAADQTTVLSSSNRSNQSETHSQTNGKGLRRNIESLFILSRAYARINAVGSSTALVAILNGKKLSVCNLGDSGF
jgi:hypothetical protein